MLDKSQQIAYFENLIKDTDLDDQSKMAMLDIIAMNKKELVLTVHKGKVSQLKGKDKRWHTYVKVNEKNKEIKAPTEKALYETLYDFYSFGTMTFSQLFNEWIQYKSTITSSPGTIRRHEQHFQKYFVKENSKLLHMNIAKINKTMLRSECNLIVKNHNLTRKEWYNVKTILNGMFEYACEKNLIKDNLCDHLKITVKFRQVVKKDDDKQMYTDEEYQAIHKYLDETFEETGDSALLAVKFQFYTGLRVGELIALKWEDVNFSKKTLHVVREESNVPTKDENGIWHDNRVVVPHTKTYTDRTIALLPKALDILKTVDDSYEYIFTRDGVRITERQINYILEKYAKYAGTEDKRSHKMRRTYASRMFDAGINANELRKDLGHSNILTTIKYIHSESTDKDYDIKAAAI